MFSSLKGLSAIITGGTSGLGLATAKKLLADGCKVLVCDIKKSPEFEEIANECVYCETDVTSEQDAINAIDTAKKKFSNLHILVNCAGIAVACKTYNVSKKKPHPLDLFEKVIKINTIGTFNMVRLASSLMVENQPDCDNQRGVVINTASVAAFEGQVGQAAYAASKAAVAGLTLPLARDFAREGIRVMAIAPGLLKTKTILGDRGYGQDSSAYLADIQLVIERLGDPVEFANLVTQVIQSPYLNGFFETPMLSGLPAGSQLAKLVPHPQRLGKPNEYAQLVMAIIQNPMLNGEVIRLDGAVRMPP